MLIAAIAVLIVLLLAFLAWLWAIAPQTGPRRPDFAKFKKYDYAHRGLHDLEHGVPENSMRGFMLAEENGYGMEFDLQLTKDKLIVVHHDPTLKRSCGEDVTIADVTWEQLQSYRLFGADEPIPLFGDVLRTLKGTTPLIIELKGYNDPAELCELTMKELAGYKGLYCIESFDPRIVRWFRDNRPEIVRGQLMGRYKKGDGGMSALRAFSATHMLSNFYNRPNFEAYDLNHRDIPSMELSKKLLGMQEVSWTIRSMEQYERTRELGSLCIFEHIRPGVPKRW